MIEAIVRELVNAHITNDHSADTCARLQDLLAQLVVVEESDEDVSEDSWSTEKGFDS